MNGLREVYIVKAAPPEGVASAGRIPFAWAARVRREGPCLHAEDIRFPLVREREGRLVSAFGKLAARSFQGLAFPALAPDWFSETGSEASEYSADSVLGPARPRAADTGHPPLRGLPGGPLARFCRHPEIAMALAQDRLASTIGPLLAVPDLLANEDRLFEEWKAMRPSAAAEAEDAADSAENSPGGGPVEVRNLLRRLRLAALRRLDASAVGREIFEPSPEFFGEAYWALDLPGPEPIQPIKMGRVRSAFYWPSPEGEERSRAVRSAPEIVSALESALLPFAVPLSGKTAPDSDPILRWIEAAPLREFQASGPLPLFPFRAVSPGGQAPGGYLVRISAASMKALGGSFLTLAAAGISPYIAEPFAAYCEERHELLAEWARDPEGLAAFKWGGAA